ncbi:hypothetical protein NFI96_029568 [Prochilodus magdalenae]|nr:hypothetical protein NFI96_029568 [Prochilodus magdalenae]
MPEISLKHHSHWFQYFPCRFGEIVPAVRDVMMNRTFQIISMEFPQFDTSDWTDWFKVAEKDIHGGAQWLTVNLGLFSTIADYSDLKDLNVSGVEVLDSLSPQQKAELVLDPSSGALENQDPGEGGDDGDSLILWRGAAQCFLPDFCQPSPKSLPAESVRVVVPEESVHCTGQFPALVVAWIPGNLSCDSYKAILRGMDTSLAVLPLDLEQQLRSSRETLSQTLPKGIQSSQLPKKVSGVFSTPSAEGRLPQTAQVPTGNVSAQLCNVSISDYACSSVAALSSGDLVKVMACQLTSSMNYSRAIWTLFFQKFAAPLDEALEAYSNTTLNVSLPDPYVLDAVGEVRVNNFSDVQLRDPVFIREWFQTRLRPFLSSVSADFLSCLSSKNFSCQTYQSCVRWRLLASKINSWKRSRSGPSLITSSILSSQEMTCQVLGETSPLSFWHFWHQRLAGKENFGNFSSFATLEELVLLNDGFSSFESLDLVTPSQAAELTLTSGALNSTSQMELVFDRLHRGEAFRNVDEFLTALTDEKVKLNPVLPSLTAEMLATAVYNTNCTNFRVIVSGISGVFSKMTASRREEITKALVKHLKNLAAQLNTPGCRKDIHGGAQWLTVNLGLFSTIADYSDLKDLNVSGVEVLDSLSPQQKAELVLDPSSGALENQTLVKEVMTGIVSSSGEEQLSVFFQTFVNVTKEAKTNFIKNAAVRDTILNVTLTALAPSFEVFQPSQYELWFQKNLFTVLASFQPSWLPVIPGNLSCDSYKAILRGMDTSLAVLPLDLEQQLRSSRETLSQTLPKGIQSSQLPKKVSGVSSTPSAEGRLPQTAQVPTGNVSAQLCNVSISDYACSSVAALSSGDLVKVMACQLTSSMNYSRAIWNLFFQKFAAPLDEALEAYSNTTLNVSLPDPYVLDAVGEVRVNNFSDVQLRDPVFIREWFQTRLRPFLSSVSADFLSCLSSKNFSCQTYQVVVEALSQQDQLMEEEQKWSIFNYFIYPFLSRNDLSDRHCLSGTSGIRDWLAKNFGNFSSFATLEELVLLNDGFSSFESLDLVTPSQAAELTLTSGALNSTSQMELVFDRLHRGEAFRNVDEFLTALTDEKVGEIVPAVRDVMMNRTFQIISMEFPQFDTSDWTDWFKVKLNPVLPSLTAEMLATAVYNTNCTNYRVIVSGISGVFSKMTASRREEITKALVKHLKNLAAQLNTPGCRKDIHGGAQWLTVNLGLFSTIADYSDLKDLNVSGVEVLDSLSPQQKAELVLDPSSGALENQTLVKEVMTGIVSSSGEEQLSVFFQTFVNVTKEAKTNFIKNAAVRDTILNVTLTALAPSFEVFQPSQYELWFQKNLFTVLASFQPSWLPVIPGNLSCDSYKAILRGMDTSLAVLPLDLEQQLRSSRETLSQTLPKGIQSSQLPKKVSGVSSTPSAEGRLPQTAQVPTGNVSAQLCNVSISDYACSSVAALSSGDLVKVMACQLTSSMNYSRAIWNLFFQKFAAPLDEALEAYSNTTLNVSLPDPYVLDAVGEVRVNNFSDVQLRDPVFIREWFQTRLRPFLSSVSADFLSCLSSKNFSCQTYQVVVEALSQQDQLMEEEQKWSIFNYFIYPFLSRNDLSDRHCLSGTSGIRDWLAKNFGNFSSFATLEELVLLNDGFSSFESLDLVTPSQAAELTLTSGALNSTSQMELVFDRLHRGEAFRNVDEFLTALTDEKVGEIVPAVRDVMMNRTFQIISMEFPQFDTSDWTDWFKVKLNPVLPSLTAEMLATAVYNTNCTNFRVIVSGISGVFSKMTASRREEITKALVKHLKNLAAQLNTPGCRKDIHGGAQWLTVNLGLFSTIADYSDLKDLNVSGVEVLDSLSPQQKAELVLDPSSGALENQTLVKEVMTGIVSSSGEEQLSVFFQTFVNVTKEAKTNFIKNAAVRDTILNVTLTALAPSFEVFQPSQYELWFQKNLFTVLASFQPSWLPVIPGNLSCDSYKAILRGMDTSLAVLPLDLEQQLRSSRETLSQTLPKGIQSSQLPKKVSGVSSTPSAEGRLPQSAQVPTGNVSAQLCNVSISDYACSSVAALSSGDLVKVMACQLTSSMNYSRAIWNLFFQKFAAPLDEALEAYSNTTLNVSLPDPYVLDAVGEVRVNNFSDVQLRDPVFIREWFQTRLRPFLSSASADFLSCLSSKNFSCQTYQVVVEALSQQDQLMEEEQKWSIFNYFIYPFLSRNDLSDRHCLSGTSGIRDWLAKNFGNFSSFATLEELVLLNDGFSSFESLDLVTPSQAAELTLTSGALNSTSQMELVFDRLHRGEAFRNVDEFLTALTDEKVGEIVPAVRDVMMNRTFQIISMEFPQFDTSDWTDWFKVKLNPVLPSLTAEMLATAVYNTNCTNFRVIVSGISGVFSKMTASRREVITKALVKHLKNLAAQLNTPGCRKDIHGGAQWLTVNLGLFSTIADYSDLKDLNVSGVEVLDSLSPQQKAELVLDPSSGALENQTLVKEVMTGIVSSSGEEQLSVFFQTFVNVTKEMNMTRIPQAVSDTILNVTLLGLGTRFQTFSTQDFTLWFQTYLRLLLPGIGPNTLSVIPRNISCDSYREIVKGFKDVQGDLSVTQSGHIFSFIQDYLQHQTSQGPNVLQCYGGGSFYVFLRNSFLGFGFPDLSTFLSLVPASRQREVVLTLRGSDSDSETVDTSLSNTLLGSISTGELREYLNGSTTVGSDLCRLLTNYNRTTQYLETEPVVSAAVGRQTLECVWSRALAASSPVEVDQWFKVTLAQYLPFLSSKVINPTQLSGASCLSYRRLVSVLGKNYDYSGADFTPADVYSSIRAYLNSSDGAPRCYNSSDPLLNSTAWFSNNIGTFVTFITLTDLQSFVSDGQIGVFLDNSENLQLFNNSGIPANVTTYYSTQLYIQNPNFNPLRLPGMLLCGAPGSVFVSLQAGDSKSILEIINKFCSQINPEVSTALVANFPTLSASTIQELGNQSIGLTQGQISSAPPTVISGSLSMLSTVTGWNQGQVNVLLQILIRAGFNINSASSLVNLGTLIGGVPSATISSIPSTELLAVSQNPTFITNILSAPVVLQQTYVQKLEHPHSVPADGAVGVEVEGHQAFWTYDIRPFISVLTTVPPHTDSLGVSTKTKAGLVVLRGAAVCRWCCTNRRTHGGHHCSLEIVSVDQTKVVENVPDALAAYIQPVHLTSLKLVDVSLINKKSWSQQQAALLFGAVSTAAQDTEGLSESILQGFTCSSVQKLPQQKVTQLVKACRPRPGRSKVFLKESQLTCMYRYVKDDPSLSFTDLPSDMLLYYSYEKVKVSCRSYFSALGGADFSVLSSVLNRQSILFKNARACLGITGVGLTRDQVEVLGNMACTLDSTYIQNSDPLILEKLKNCGDLSDSQVAAVQTLLYSGSTPYGNPSAWNQQTLQQLGTLPLYLRQDFWSRFSSAVRKRYLRSFLPFLRRRKTQKWKLSRLFRAYSTVRSKRSADCTVGNITAVTIADETFPFDYDSTQFDLCLDVTVLSDGLAAVTEKVVDPSYQTVILHKLKQLYPSGLPEGVVQLLGATSRAATVEDISRWNITTVDTLSSLMNPDNGDWSPEQSKAVIMKYLGVPGNTLGTAELDAVGSNICSVDVGVLRAVTADSLRNASPLDISSCSIDQKAVLYGIAKSSFSTQRSDPTAYYQLISPYLAGAPVEDIQALSSLNISMDITTFLSLDPAVVTALSVSTVGGLMGASVADLQLFENTTVIRAWEAQQKQSELDTLNLGLQGGIPDVITSTSRYCPPTLTTAAVTNTVTTFISTASITAIAGLNSTDSTTSRISVTAIDSSATTASSANTTVTAIASISTTNSADSNATPTTTNINTTISTPVNANITVSFVGVNGTTANAIHGSVNNTSDNTNITGNNTTVSPNASSNTTITIASVNTTTVVNTINGSVNNNTNNATTVSPTVSSNTTITLASVNATTINVINGSVNSTTNNATTVSNDLSASPTASPNTTITVASFNATTISIINGNVNNHTNNATTVSNTTVSPTVSSNTTITIASVNATIASTINGNINVTNTSNNYSNTSLSTTVTPTASPNTNVTGASFNATTVSVINGNVNNNTNNATTVSPTVSPNTNVTGASFNATTVSVINGSVNNNNTNNATTVSNTTVSPTVSPNTNVTGASFNATTVSVINGSVNNNNTNNATTVSNTTVSPTVSPNTNVTSASVNATIVSTINSNINVTNTSNNSSNASLNTTISPTASSNTTITVTSGNTTNGNINNASISANTDAPTSAPTRANTTAINATTTVSVNSTVTVTAVSITEGGNTSTTAGVPTNYSATATAVTTRTGLNTATSAGVSSATVARATTTAPGNPCQGVDSYTLGTLAPGSLSAVLCNFSIPDFACSSVTALPSDDLASLLRCKPLNTVAYSKEIWTLFFQRFSASLDEGLDKYSTMAFNLTLRDPYVLDAIGEVKVNNFSEAQLTDGAFISEWFQTRLRPFLSSVSADFLSILSSKNFSCQTYQVVK